MVITPSPGRIVWYCPGGGDTFAVSGNGRCAAIVTEVHSERLVNLCVFDANGHTHERASVPLLQEGDPRPPADHFFCQWMPFQLAQARQQETLAGAGADR